MDNESDDRLELGKTQQKHGSSKVPLGILDNQQDNKDFV